MSITLSAPATGELLGAERDIVMTADHVVGGPAIGNAAAAAFDPTTNSMSIVILGGSVDNPVYFRLHKEG